MKNLWTDMKLKLLNILEKRRDRFVENNPGIVIDSFGRKFDLDHSKSIDYYNKIINTVTQKL